jgi:hypothetical protein
MSTVLTPGSFIEDLILMTNNLALGTQESKKFPPMFFKHLPYIAIASVCKETGLASEVGISVSPTGLSLVLFPFTSILTISPRP